MAGSVRIEIDESVCAGTMMCLSIAPDAFDVVQGVARVVDPTAHDLETLREAEESCPTEAIRIFVEDA
jgi:ferredoxin